MFTKMSNTEKDKILEKWYVAKEKIAILTERIESYKKDIEREMRKTGENVLKGGGYTITKKTITKRYVSKDCLPEEIFNKYAVKTQYDSYYLSKKG
jgi:hypothetical protein